MRHRHSISVQSPSALLCFCTSLWVQSLQEKGIKHSIRVLGQRRAGTVEAHVHQEKKKNKRKVVHNKKQKYSSKKIFDLRHRNYEVISQKFRIVSQNVDFLVVIMRFDLIWLKSNVRLTITQLGLMLSWNFDLSHSLHLVYIIILNYHLIISTYLIILTVGKNLDSIHYQLLLFNELLPLIIISSKIWFCIAYFCLNK